MSFLDELRKQADEVKVKEQQQQKYREQLKETFEKQVKPKAKKLFLYLREMALQLNMIKPDTRVDYTLRGAGVLKKMLQEEYIIGTYDEQTNSFFLRFMCRNPRPVRFDITKREDVTPMHDYLWSHNVPFTENQVNDGRQAFLRTTFVLRGEIIVEFKFQANYEESTIDVQARNFEGLGRREYRLRPEDITDEFLDSFGRYLVRHMEDGEFMQPYQQNNKPSKRSLPEQQQLKEKIRQDIIRNDPPPARPAPLAAQAKPASVVAARARTNDSPGVSSLLGKLFKKKD